MSISKVFATYRKGHVDGARQHPGCYYLVSFPLWFLGCVGNIGKLKLTCYLSEPGVCVSNVWAQNGKKGLLDFNLCLLCP